MEITLAAPDRLIGSTEWQLCLAPRLKPGSLQPANFEREADLSSPASHRLLDYRGIDHGSKDFSKVIVARLVSLKRSRVDHRNVGLSAMMAAPASGK